MENIGIYARCIKFHEANLNLKSMTRENSGKE